jgi:Ala-tRNA(Pro) deacylase
MIPLMTANRQDLFRRLAELDIATRTVEHEPLFTVAESSKVERELPGAHTKNLFLKDEGGELFLIVAESTTRVDLKALARTLRAGRFSFGKPELLIEALGVMPGSVTAFAVINDPNRRVRVIIDAELMKHDNINCHPLENTATTNIGRDDLLRFIRACGHEPKIATLGPTASESANSS